MLSRRCDIGKSGEIHPGRARCGWLRVLGVTLLAALAIACGPALPQPLLDAANAVKGDLDFADKAIAEARSSYEAFMATAAADRIRPYAEREGWAKNFDEATSELEHAQRIVRDEIDPTIERDLPEEAEQLRAQVQRARDSLNRVGELRREPRLKAVYFQELADGKGTEIVGGLGQRVSDADLARAEHADEVAKAAVDHPEKKDDLAQRVATLDANESEAREALSSAGDELDALGTSAEDLSALAAHIAVAEKATQALEAGRTDLEARVAQLYRAYSKTLIDMRADTLVKIGRTSWNDYVDFPSEHDYYYSERLVPEAHAATFESWGDRALGNGFTTFIDRDAWNSLSLNTRENVPAGDNAYEFWIADTRTQYFHRYTYVENDTHRDGDWEEVSEDVYEDNYENLGMDIVAKPYGSYADEALTQAMPPGYAYVGDPRYGRWETMPDGRRRWSWLETYAFYHLMFGGPRHYYYHRDWDPWYRGYRGRDAWYGSGTGGGYYYGTRGSMLAGSSRYQGSRFGRSGGFQRAAASFRGAGPDGRGGGPGSRGK